MWEKETDDVSVVFSSRVWPYLVVSSHFLKYSAELLPQFRSKYGLILFEFLYSKACQYGYGSFIVSVDEIRWITGTTDTHPRFERFFSQVVQLAVDDINKNVISPIMVSAEKVKDGKKVGFIKFKVRNRTSYAEKDFRGVVRPKWLKEKVYQTDIFGNEEEVDL